MYTNVANCIDTVSLEHENTITINNTTIYF